VLFRHKGQGRPLATMRKDVPMTNLKFAAMALSAALVTMPAFAGDTPSAPGAKQYFVDLKDGDTVKGPVLVRMGLSGMGIAPAGTEKDNTGHHHILLNRAPYGDGPDDAEMDENGLFADDNHIHYGGGQTEVTLDLPAGTHTLQLVLGDLYHVPHDPIVKTEQITIVVE